MSLIVVSIGTSLITNNSKILKSHHGSLTYLFDESEIDTDKVKALSINIETDGSKNIKPDDLPKVLKDYAERFFENYLDEEKIRQNIKKREAEGSGYQDENKDLLPAEISSLYLYYYMPDGTLRDDFKERLKEGSKNEFTEKDDLILLTTDTPDAIYCAKMIQEMIVYLPLFKDKCKVNDIKVIENLNVYDPEKYVSNEDASAMDIAQIADKGLGRLFLYFKETFGKSGNYGNCVKKILIRTGGYKEFSADLKMLAMEFGFKSYYLFERSTEMLVVAQLSWPKKSFSQVALKTRRQP